MKERIYVIVGPTASGKSSFALALAEKVKGEIVSADSMQIYRGMDIGTAKPTREDQRRIVHHMIDIADPDERYSAARFQTEAGSAIEDIIERGKVPIVAGGTGLYINALTFDLHFDEVPESTRDGSASERPLTAEEAYRELVRLDPAAAERVHPNNHVRVFRALEIARSGAKRQYDFNRPSDRYDYVLIGFDPPRDLLYETIERRVDSMVKKGLVDEVRSLYARFGASPQSMQAIGYKEIASALENNEASLDNAIDAIKRNTRRFAKRQRTWFRRDARIQWFSGPDDRAAIAYALDKRPG